jgi:hypothetical protein
VKVSIDTEQDSYDKAAATLRAAYGISATSTMHREGTNGSGPENTGEDRAENFWNRERLAEFAHWLAPGAAEAVRYIAAHAPAVSMDEAIAHMGAHLGEAGFSGQQMGGRMASVGFSWKAVSGAEEAPLETDYRYRVYRMDEAIAATLRDLMGEPGQPS